MLNHVQQIKTKISEEPQKIEELVELKEYMSNMPIEIEKIKVEINKCFDIYKTLDEFSWRFPNEDLNKKWQVFGSPKEIF